MAKTPKLTHEYTSEPPLAARIPKAPNRFTVTLKAQGNPDRREVRNITGCPPEVVGALSVEEASALCRAYLENHNLGGGNWTGGQLYDATGAFVGRFSYNGRLWSPDGKTEILRNQEKED